MRGRSPRNQEMSEISNYKSYMKLDGEWGRRPCGEAAWRGPQATPKAARNANIFTISKYICQNLQKTSIKHEKNFFWRRASPAAHVWCVIYNIFCIR